MAMLSKVIYRFNEIPIKKIPKVIFHKNRIINPKFDLEAKRLQISKTILSKETNADGIIIPDFKLYYRAIVTKATWYWHKKQTRRPME
jgi:hypothetical protein